MTTNWEPPDYGRWSLYVAIVELTLNIAQIISSR